MSLNFTIQGKKIFFFGYIKRNHSYHVAASFTPVLVASLEEGGQIDITKHEVKTRGMVSLLD